MREWVKTRTGLSRIRNWKLRLSQRCWRTFTSSGICRCKCLPVDTVSNLWRFEHSPIWNWLLPRSFRWRCFAVGSNTLDAVHLPYFSIRTTTRKRIPLLFWGQWCASTGRSASTVLVKWMSLSQSTRPLRLVSPIWLMMKTESILENWYFNREHWRCLTRSALKLNYRLLSLTLPATDCCP